MATRRPLEPCNPGSNPGTPAEPQSIEEASGYPGGIGPFSTSWDTHAETRPKLTVAEPVRRSLDYDERVARDSLKQVRPDPGRATPQPTSREQP